MNVDEVIKFMEAHGFTFKAQGEDGPNVVLHFIAPKPQTIVEIAVPLDATITLDKSFEAQLTQIH